MKHEPSSLLGHAKVAVNFPRRDAVLAVRSLPHDREPLVETYGRIFKDRSRFDAELALGMPCLALPHATSGDKGNVSATAGRASHNASRPTTSDEVIKTIIWNRKVWDRLKESLWFVVFGFHKPILAGVV
jgi:hypothetical protein